MRFLNPGSGLLVAVVAAFGHHSTAPYDLVHGTIVEGVVASFKWENPHSHLYVDVAGEENVIEHWTVELDGPGQLRRLGWTESTVKAGDRVTVTGGRAKNGSFHLRGVYVQFPDGRKLMCLPAP